MKQKLENNFNVLRHSKISHEAWFFVRGVENLKVQKKPLNLIF